MKLGWFLVGTSLKDVLSQFLESLLYIGLIRHKVRPARSSHTLLLGE
jgi:hypothetical protein